jgi:hypothetical protein
VGTLSAFAARHPGLFGGEDVSPAFLMSRLATLAARLAGFLGREFVGGPLLVGCFSAQARYLPLPLRIHGGEASLALFCHDKDPFLNKR